ncbi:MAG TPA: LysE family transporter, partial [Anaerolineae bacterium]|nr:LysE family transporter [Anaerolineae bacterium]
MMPGPLLTVTISETAKKGQISAFMLIVGHSILEFILAVGFTFGLYAVLKNPTIIRAIGILGGGFLLWMGSGLVTDAYRGRVSLDLSQRDEHVTLGPVLQGIITSLSNPYWTLWWVTVGARFILSSLRHGLPGLTSFYFGHIAGDFLWYA